MIEGVVNIYKEKGYTSHDVVARLRGILQMKKIGHTGTLDPDAEGVLPVCLGHATRLCDMLTDERKVYRAVMLLGTETDTQDISGQVLKQLPVQVTAAQVAEVIAGFAGEYDQIPPMYSALKVRGKKLYELARQGKTVERAARRVTIHKITIDSIELPRVAMTVECSKGTYIRTLCHDIGRRLSCGACMEKLLRIRVGRFRLEDAITLAEAERLRDAGTLESHVVTVEEIFERYPKAIAEEEADRLAHNGNPLKSSQVKLERPGTAGKRVSGEAVSAVDAGGPHYRLYDSKGCFIGIYRYEEDQKRLKPEKMFIATEAAG